MLEAAIDRCEQRNPDINAVVHMFPDRARDSLGGRGGALYGVPFLLKDAGANYAGEPTGHACRLFAGHVAEKDTTLANCQRYPRAAFRPG